MAKAIALLWQARPSAYWYSQSSSSKEWESDMGNETIYQKLMELTEQITRMEDKLDTHLQYHASMNVAKSRRSEFWDKVLVGGIGAGIAFGLTGIKTLLGWK